MGSAYDTLYKWARRTTTSFAELSFLSSLHDESAEGDDALVYRLKQWPELPARHRTAEVYRALSLMSNRPVNRSWFLRHSRMKPKVLDGLIDRLVAQGAVEVIDVSAYR
ncbi:MAG TPA: hypothetical protein VL593_10855 [Ramlibacter sp.]|nr:hypothetical protein [Ramlibacter sp.]